MFLQRQDVLDEIDELFVHGDDGQIYFRPKGQRHLLAVSTERYERVMVEARVRHRRAMAATWIVGLGLGAASIWVVIDRGKYGLAFALLALNLIWSVMHHLSHGRAVLGPLVQEWRDDQRILSRK